MISIYTYQRFIHTTQPEYRDEGTFDQVCLINIVAAMRVCNFYPSSATVWKPPVLLINTTCDYSEVYDVQYINMIVQDLGSSVYLRDGEVFSVDFTATPRKTANILWMFGKKNLKVHLLAYSALNHISRSSSVDGRFLSSWKWLRCRHVTCMWSVLSLGETVWDTD